MNDLHTPGSDITPEIDASWQAGRLTMRGDSYPENALELFAPVTDWVSKFLLTSGRGSSLDLYLNYLNTSSVKAVVDIFEILEVAYSNGASIEVHWFYERGNERAADVANEFKEDCCFPFDVLPQELVD